MDYDFYNVGFGEGIWINGSHWYADPFYLYSDFKIDRQYESTLFDIYVAPQTSTMGGSGSGQDLYFLYAAINSGSDPIPTPVPVPEPSSFMLFLIGLLGIFLFNKVLTRRSR